jgi:hypothetical protein
MNNPNTKKNIYYYRQRNYGVDHLYPTDPDIANALILLTGNKTITTRIMTGLNLLGFTTEETVKSNTTQEGGNV